MTVLLYPGCPPVSFRNDLFYLVVFVALLYLRVFISLSLRQPRKQNKRVCNGAMGHDRVDVKSEKSRMEESVLNTGKRVRERLQC